MNCSINAFEINIALVILSCRLIKIIQKVCTTSFIIFLFSSICIRFICQHKILASGLLGNLYENVSSTLGLDLRARIY